MLSSLFFRPPKMYIYIVICFLAKGFLHFPSLRSRFFLSLSSARNIFLACVFLAKAFSTSLDFIPFAPAFHFVVLSKKLFLALLPGAGKADTQSPLEFTDQLRVRDGLPALVLAHDLRFLVDLLLVSFRVGTNKQTHAKKKKRKTGKKRVRKGIRDNGEIKEYTPKERVP